MNEQYFTIKQAAGILGVTPLTLRNWDKRGRLIAYRNPVNNYRLYRYADIADFLAASRQSGPRQSEVRRLAVRLEEETAAESAMAAPDADEAPDGGGNAVSEFAEEPPATYDNGETPAGNPEWPSGADEEQSDAEAV